MAVRIGLLGASRIAPSAVIAPASGRNDASVTAVAARDPATAHAFARAHGIAKVHTRYEDLVADPDIDLVYNGLPPHRHADLTIAALQAGKAVLCEKPFAMNARQAEAMVRASEQTGGVLIEAFHYRFHPAFQRALDLIRRGTLGELRRIRAEFSVPIPFRPGELRHTLETGGGALMDLGCYPVHWVRTVVGREPDVVAAQARWDRPQIDVAMQAQLVWPRQGGPGVTGEIECSMAEDATRAAVLDVEGSLGRLVMHNPIAPHRGHQIVVTVGELATVETVDGRTTYDHQLGHVLDVLAGRAQPLTGGRDAVANMAVIDAIYTASGLAPRGMGAG